MSESAADGLVDADAVWPAEMLCPAGDGLEIDEAIGALRFLIGAGSPRRDGWTKLDTEAVSRLLDRIEVAADVILTAVARPVGERDRG